MRLLKKLLAIGALGGGNTIHNLFMDNFYTPDASPISSPRAWEPGPILEWTAVQNDGQLDVVGGELVLLPQTTPLPQDLTVFVAGGISRLPGYAMAFRSKFSLATIKLSAIGFNNDPAAAIMTEAIGLGIFDGYFTVYDGTGGHRSQTSIIANTYYNEVVILRDNGGFGIIDNKLVGVLPIGNQATVYPHILGYTQQLNVDWVKMGQLGSPWDTSYGPGARVVSGAISVGQVFTHEPNALIYFTLTNRGSAGASIIKFRRQDANNYWKVTINSDGSADLSVVEAGTPTSVGTAAAGTFESGTRCHISAGVFGISNQINIHNVFWEQIVYTNATEFSTETVGELSQLATDAVISDLEVYPIDLSGSALSWVTRLVGS